MADHFSTTRSVARKEFRGFFATPAAYLFLGAFLAVSYTHLRAHETS
mgnify:CR=1 FL=1